MASSAPKPRRGRATSKAAAPTRTPARPASRAAAQRRRLLTWALATAGLAVVAVVGLIAANTSGGGTGSASPARFDLPTISGSGRVRLADFAGRPTVVNFFASWCDACDAELPSFSTVSAKLKGQVNFVGVDALETGDPLYMPRRHDITWWPLARDIGGANRSGLHDALCQCSSMPVTAFYDANGRLLNVDRQALIGDTLATELHKYYGISA